MELPAQLFTELAERARFEPAGTRGTGPNRRTAPRVRIAMEAAVVRLNAGPKVKPLAITIRDLSIRGVGFEGPEPFRVTDQFALRLIRADGSILWVQCEVVRWAPIAADRFSVGAMFHKFLATPAKPAAPAENVTPVPAAV
jgi:hypothetical protein